MAIPSLAMMPSGYKDGKVYSVLPSNGNGDFNFTRASSATRVNKDGLIETVGNGIPRLDYLNGSCPSLLLEPQSTNIVTYSQSLTESIYGTSNAVILDNNVTSPDGTLNASSITDSNGGGTSVTQIFLANLSVDTSSQYTYSIFAKKKGLNYISLRVEQFTTPASSDCFFDLENGSIVSVAAGYDSAKIENYGNGWYRCSVTFTTDAVDASGNLVVRLSEDGISTSSVPQDGTSSVYLWGWSCEKQSYPTSYIPTNGAAVTRAAETATGAGNDQVINSTEGVFYAEVENSSPSTSTRGWVLQSSLNNGSDLISIRFNSSQLINMYLRANSVTTINVNVSNTYNGFIKIALKYKSGENSLWINGVEVHSNSTTFSFSNSLSNLSNYDGLGNYGYFNIKDTKLYNTALTDNELQALTTI